MSVVVSDITETSARISWTVPFLVSSQETYTIVYGINSSSLTEMSTPLNSIGPNVSIVYTQSLLALDPAETYYFRIIASNAAGSSGTDIYSFMTPSARKYMYHNM